MNFSQLLTFTVINVFKACVLVSFAFIKNVCIGLYSRPPNPSAHGRFYSMKNEDFCLLPFKDRILLCAVVKYNDFCLWKAAFEIKKCLIFVDNLLKTKTKVCLVHFLRIKIFGRQIKGPMSDFV